MSNPNATSLLIALGLYASTINPSVAAKSPTIEITDYCTPRQINNDITQCAQAAINAVAPRNNSYGGGIVHFPASLSPYQLLGTLTIPYSFVTLEGDGPQATLIRCGNGRADCIAIGGGHDQTRGQAVLNLGMVGDAKTGGAAVTISNAFNVRIENATFDQMVNGIDLAGANNSITLRDIIIVDNQPNSEFGVYWHDRADGASRSDVLTINNVVIEGDWSNATGFLWDGFANTVVGSGLRILHQAYGVHVMNSAHSQSYYPQFLNIFDMELEGFKATALKIDAGRDFKIVGSDINNLTGGPQGKADKAAIAISADIGASTTAGVSIINSRIGDSHLEGLYSEARDVQLSNDVFFSTSGIGPSGASVIRLAPSSSDVLLSNIRCEEFGGLAYAAYCISVDAGAQGIIANTIDARYVRNGAILDHGSVGASYIGIIQPNGQPDSLLK